MTIQDIASILEKVAIIATLFIAIQCELKYKDFLDRVNIMYELLIQHEEGKIDAEEVIEEALKEKLGNEGDEEDGRSKE